MADATLRTLRGAAGALLALAVLITALLVLAALLTPRPWAFNAGAPGDAYLISDAFAPEGWPVAPLRWLRETATLRLAGAYAGPTRLELRLFRAPEQTAGLPWPTMLSTNGRALARFEALPGWRRYQLALPPGATLRPLALTSPSFVPGGADARTLGLALDWAAVLPLAGVAPLAYAAERALWVGLLLLLAASAAWGLDAWGRGQTGAAGRPWRVLALTAGLGAGAAGWAWLGPRSFAWGLPTSWPGLSAATGMLAVLAGLAWAGERRTPTARGAVRWPWLALGPLVLLAHLALLLPLPVELRQLAALGLLLLPGALAALALFGGEADLAERGFLAVAGALVIMILLLLALHALPGPVRPWQALLVADGLTALAVWALWRQRSTPILPLPERPLRWLLPPLALAAGLRLWGLGRSEFQGDEAYAMMLAKGVAHGQAQILMVHMKGPAEALLPAGPLALTGTITELVARLPFALAGVALVAGVWALAGRLIGGRRGDLAGLIAAVAVAADGLLLAFGRIVQYQTVVLLLSTAVLWLAWRFYVGGAAWRYLPAAACCAAGAVLAHYDAIYVTPALAWLVLAGGLRRRWSLRKWVAGLMPPVTLGLGLSLSFYLPFVLHEHFARTLGHLSTRSGQGGVPMLYNNLPDYAELFSVYATRYLVFAAGLALLLSLAWLLLVVLRPHALAAAMAALLVGGGLLASLTPQLLASSPGTSLAALLILPPLVALALAPRLPAGLRVLVIWLTPALAAHAFLLADPRTHFYTLHPAAWLLVGYGAAALALRLPPMRPLLAAAGATLLTLCLTYTALVVLRPWPEYERAYPASLLPFFTPLSGAELPDDGLFGFPGRDGWKAAAVLFQRGELRGAFETNAKLFTPGWYLRGQFKCARDPDYFLTANSVQPFYVPAGYHLFGTVTVGGMRALEIYAREPVVGPPRWFTAEQFAPAYDASPVPNFPLRRLLSGEAPQTSLVVNWRAGFTLRGFDLDRAALGPDDPAFVTLYWHAARPLSANLEPAVLVRDAAGQSIQEAAPFCRVAPAELWHTADVHDASFRIAPGTLPSGAYTLYAGVRDRTTGAWLPLADGTELAALGALTVR